MKKLIGGLIVALANACGAQDFMYETFDGYLLGPITAYNGWGQTNFLTHFTNTQPAQVSNVLPATSPNGLQFAPPAGDKQMTLAMYTNLNAQYSYTGPNHPVLRTSFMLYKENARQNFAFLQGLDGDEMGILTDTNDGTIIVNETDTGISFVTGRYAEVVYLYNMSNNDSCVQYDGTNILNWSGTDAPSLTQIVYAAFCRFPDAYAGAPLGVDQVHVDKPTPGTVAWFRYETPTNVASDHAGYFRASRIIGGGNGSVAASPPLFDGVQERVNDLGRASFRLAELLPWTNTTKMSEWTLEAILAARPEAVETGGNLQFLDWGTGSGTDTTNAQINLVWLRTTQQLSLYLRDARQTTAANQYLPSLGDMAADGRWHHVALVKTGAWLSVYVDYRPMSHRSLDGTASGDYEFYSSSHTRIGESNNGGNSSNPYQLLDELRFTARALRTSEFLQFGQPEIVSAPDPTAANWNLDVMTISGRTYNVETASRPGAMPWTTLMPVNIATGHYSTFTIPATTNRALRIVRQ